MSCGFFLLLSSIFLSSPNLSCRTLDVYHFDRWCGPSANLECRAETYVLHAARCKHRTQKSLSRHHRATLSGHIFATKAHIDNRKNLLNSNISSTCPNNVVNFGPLLAEICWRVWSTTANFNGFRLLAALLRGSLLVGVSQTLRR